jgi:hypothetical protein
MGTRCTINFTEDQKDKRVTVATIYRHWDGDPKTMMEDLAKFFADVEEQCGRDTRFDDASYLAAKYVVWQAGKYTRDPERPLLFLGIGILDAGGTQSDLEWIYDVACDGSRPEVTHREYRAT